MKITLGILNYVRQTLNLIKFPQGKENHFGFAINEQYKKNIIVHS